jgi:hypothetical protein
MAMVMGLRRTGFDFPDGIADARKSTTWRELNVLNE